MSGNLKTFRIALAVLFTFIVGSLSAQTVKGNVKDSSGEPVIGATVQEKGTKNAVATDLDGNFSISLTSGKQLQISYIGMKTKSVNVAGKTSINVTLEDEATGLNDVVVIGYGSVKKKDITGSVATVDNKALVAVPVASASEALTGKMAGVQVTTTEGSPDAEVKIRVRGGGSITQSNDPLYIVDGFPVETISDIPASDIEDITVLKDASSTAIYGSRGANGVILVTTKSGKSGKVNVSYNAYYSVKKIAKTMDVLTPYDYAKWQYELALLKNNGDLTKMESYTDFFGNYNDMDLYNNIAANDWQDIVYGVCLALCREFPSRLSIEVHGETVCLVGIVVLLCYHILMTEHCIQVMLACLAEDSLEVIACRVSVAEAVTRCSCHPYCRLVLVVTLRHILHIVCRCTPVAQVFLIIVVITEFGLQFQILIYFPTE